MKKSTQRRLFITAFVFSLLFFSCRENKAPGHTKENTIERVFVVNLVKDSLKQKEYLAYHRQVWPEVEAGFKKAGYKKISLYRFQNLLVMTIVVPSHASLDSMGKVAESFDKKCAEWNRTMNTYQIGVEGTEPGQTWVEAGKFYSFSNE